MLWGGRRVVARVARFRIIDIKLAYIKPSVKQHHVLESLSSRQHPASGGIDPHVYSFLFIPKVADKV